MSELLLAFAAGAAVGSFLNVCILRVPAGQSIVHPPSRCPRCGTPVRPFDNIPIVSFLILRGRCRSCEEPISGRYPLVEALTGALFAALVWRFGLSPALVAPALLVAALVTVTFIDIDHQIIPDVISLPGIAVGMGFALLGLGVPLVDSAAGAALGGGILLLVAVGYERLRGREGMGGGDIKLLAMIGAFLGWKAVLVTLVLGSLVGAVAGVVALAVRGGDAQVPIPFGPFLALGAVSALFYGSELIDLYWSLTMIY